MRLTEKERLLRALSFKDVDRPPVIIPGGMMAGVLYSIIKEANLPYPAIHTERDAMVEYTSLLQETCGIDNYGVPFCMTVEAEDFGAKVDLGDPFEGPRVTGYVTNRLDEILKIKPVNCSRHEVTLRAIEKLSGGNIPVIGNLTGPTSLLTSLIDPSCVYSAIVGEEEKVRDALEYVADHLIDFAFEQISAGADVLVLADPGASGEILGGLHFGELVAPLLRRIIGSIKTRNIPVVLHICGDILSLSRLLAEIQWDALSVDSVVSLRKLQRHFPKRTLMGNVSTHLMAVSNEDRTYRVSKRTVEISAILAPACGLSTTTLPQNVRAMVNAANDTARKLHERSAKDV